MTARAEKIAEFVHRENMYRIIDAEPWNNDNPHFIVEVNRPDAMGKESWQCVAMQGELEEWTKGLLFALRYEALQKRQAEDEDPEEVEADKITEGDDIPY